MQISLKQIQYFLAAAETGQFSAAALKVHVTQTAITSAIKELESALGVTLFLRHHASGVSLTVDGQKFLHHAYNITAAVNSALHDPGLIRQDVSGKVRVGASPSVLSLYIVPALARFVRAYAQVDVELVEMTRPELEAAVLRGDIDIAAGWLANFETPDAFQTVALTRSRRQLWLPASHPLLAKRSIALADVAPLPYVMYDMDETPRNTLMFFADHGLKPNVRYTVRTLDGVRSLIAQGLAVGVLSDASYRPFSIEGLRIETRPVLDALPFIEIGLAWHAGRAPAPAVDTFKTFMQLTFGGPASGVRVV
jgi:DNA-binding transcriptional LysR family regulator